MRIGRTIIDTDNMEPEDVEILIKELKHIKSRKLYAQSLSRRMNELVNEAKEHGFLFSSKDYGEILEVDDYVVSDMGEDYVD